MQPEASRAALPVPAVRFAADGSVPAAALEAVASAAAGAVAARGARAELRVPLRPAGGAGRGVPAAALRALAAVLAAAARGGGAEVDVVPLLEACGHTVGAGGEAGGGAGGGTGGDPPASASAEELLCDALAPRVPPGAALPLRHVSVGGTFDRLHAGHRLLLATAAAATDGVLYVGVTGDSLLRKKAHAEMLQSFEARRDTAIGYALRVRPGLEVRTSELTADAPPLAQTMPGMEALVASAETESACEAINASRASEGMPPLTLVICGLMGGHGGASGGGPGTPKLSSTDLRAAAAAAKAQEADSGAAQEPDL